MSRIRVIALLISLLGGLALASSPAPVYASQNSAAMCTGGCCFVPRVGHCVCPCP